jgi:hypothetical protein
MSIDLQTAFEKDYEPETDTEYAQAEEMELPPQEPAVELADRAAYEPVGAAETNPAGAEDVSLDDL